MYLESIDNDIHFHQKMILILTEKKLQLMRDTQEKSPQEDEKNKLQEIRHKLQNKEKKRKLAAKKRKKRTAKEQSLANLLQPAGYADIDDHKLDAKKGLKENEEMIDRIREMEQKLMENGVAPEVAKEKVREEMYPGSIPKNKDNSCVKNNLLYLNDNLEEEVDSLFTTPAVIEKLENLGIVESGAMYDKEDIVSEVTLYEE